MVRQRAATFSFVLAIGIASFVTLQASCDEGSTPRHVSSTRQALGQEWESIVSNPVMYGAHSVGFDVFVSPVSIPLAGSPNIYVRSGAPFRLRVYRLGWYAGVGATLLHDTNTASLPARNAGVLCGRDSSNSVVRQADLDYGLVECPWTNPVVPAFSAPSSGAYLVRITATIGGTVRENHALYYVRNDASTSRLVMMSATTDQAYNLWTDTPDARFPSGFIGRSLYPDHWVIPNSDGGIGDTVRATKVSFNRPQQGISDFFKTTYPLIRFLEREGIDYKVATDYDVDQAAPNSRSILVAGHSEYWSGTTRTRLDQAVAGGKNLVVLSSNAGYWQVRYETSPASLPGPVVVGYKENALITNRTDPSCPAVFVPASATTCGDPVMADSPSTNDGTATTLFRSAPVSRPEQLLFGVQYQITPAANTFELPVTLFTDRLATQQSTGTNIANSGTLVVQGPTCPGSLGVLGYETDVLHPELWMGFNPSACVRTLGFAKWEQTLEDPPVFEELGNYASQIVLYRATQSSGYVFGGLSMMWSWGLDRWASDQNLGGDICSREDATIQQLTRNMLAAADTNSFGTDCTTASTYSVFFGQTDSTAGNELVLKEDDYPGRWANVVVRSVVDSSVTTTPQIRFEPNPVGTSDLADWAVASGAYDLFLADVTGDGRADLIAKEKNSPGNWYVARNVESTPGRYRYSAEPAPWLTGWAVVSSSYRLFVGDVTGDGKADLLAKERGGANWYLAISNGSGFVFDAAHPVAFANWGTLADDQYDYFLADLNNDHRADLVRKGRTSQTDWYVAYSAGTYFTPNTSASLSGWAVASGAYDLFVADVTMDGRADLIAKEKNSPGNWYVARNVAQGSFNNFAPEASAWLSGWAVLSSGYDLRVADLNADSRADLIARSRIGGHWYVATSNGSSFLPQATPAYTRSGP